MLLCKVQKQNENKKLQSFFWWSIVSAVIKVSFRLNWRKEVLPEEVNFFETSSLAFEKARNHSKTPFSSLNCWTVEHVAEYSQEMLYLA